MGIDDSLLVGSELRFINEFAFPLDEVVLDIIGEIIEILADSVSPGGPCFPSDRLERGGCSVDEEGAFVGGSDGGLNSDQGLRCHNKIK